MASDEKAERVLVDTQLLLWGAFSPERLHGRARRALPENARNVVFSVASLWETTIKKNLGRADFAYEPVILRSHLLERGMHELEITAAHAFEVGQMPLHHNDPFDRLLIAQARVEQLAFLTTDQRLADYGRPVRLV